MAQDQQDPSIYDYLVDDQDLPEMLPMDSLSPQLAPGLLEAHHATSMGSRTTFGGAPLRQIPTRAPPPPAPAPASLSPPQSRARPHQQQQQFNFDWSSGVTGYADSASGSSSSNLFDFTGLTQQQQQQQRQNAPYAAYVSPANIDTSQGSTFSFASWGGNVGAIDGSGMALTGSMTGNLSASTAGPESRWPGHEDDFDDQEDTVAVTFDLGDDGDDDEMGDGTSRPSSSRNKRPKKGPGSSAPGGTSSGRRSSAATGRTSPAASSKASSSTSPTTSSATKQSKQLRSASRTSKNTHHKPAETAEERRTRASHNLVEKQYRNRLNAQFESLLNALPEQIRGGGPEDDEDGGGPPLDFGDRRVSKAEVLDMARRHIKTLERQREAMQQEKVELLGRLERLEQAAYGDPATGGGAAEMMTTQQQRRQQPQGRRGFNAPTRLDREAEEEEGEEYDR